VISNLSREQDIGSHFIAFFISDDTIIYFDPFGIENYNISIEQYLQKYKKQIIYSNNEFKLIIAHIVDIFVLFLFYVLIIM
jgi:hypothetical protein